MNPYREAGDAVEQEWQRLDRETRSNIWRAPANGITVTPRIPEGLPPIGRPKPAVDEFLQRHVEAANLDVARAKLRRGIIVVIWTIAVIGGAVAAGWWIVTH